MAQGFTREKDSSIVILSNAIAESFSGQNKDVVTIHDGQAVAGDPSGTGVILAIATGVATQAVGLATADVAVGFSTLYQVQGLFNLADWSNVTGSTSLLPLATYYLDTTSGMLTTSAPVVPGQIVQIIGVAVDPQTLELKLDQTVLL